MSSAKKRSVAHGVLTRMKLPLHIRLALGYSLFFALVLLLMSVGVYWIVRNTLLNEIEQELRTSAALIEQDVELRAAELLPLFTDSGPVLNTLPEWAAGIESPALYVQVVRPDGSVAARSASLAKQSLPLDDATRNAALRGETVQRILRPSSTPMMLLIRPLVIEGHVAAVLIVAQSLREIDRSLRLLLFSLGATGLIALIAAVRGGAWLARRALRPVEEIARATRQIVQADDLQRRVPEVTAPDEIGQLTTTINEMLARLERLFTAQRRFVADVSHELRTPLTAMRGHLELLRRGVVSDPAERDESMADMLREINRLTRLSNDLLLLAQAEVGLQLRHEPVALDELVLEVVRELRPLADGINLLPHIDEQVAVIGDPDRLKQALLNLAVNALQHTPPGGTVTIALDQDDTYAYLHVSDTGTGISPDDLPQLFDRFYRADGSRKQRAGGIGLGLAIVKWVAEAHGGSATAISSLGRGSTFTLSLSRHDRRHDAALITG